MSAKLASPPRSSQGGKPHLQLAELLAGLQGAPVQVAPAIAQVADIIHLLLGQLHLQPLKQDVRTPGAHLLCTATAGRLHDSYSGPGLAAHLITGEQAVHVLYGSDDAIYLCLPLSHLRHNHAMPHSCPFDSKDMSHTPCLKARRPSCRGGVVTGS